MTTHTALLLLTSETPLHAGAGQSVDGIDLPIQREVHTHWPCVFGSAVKGALRAHAEQRMASTCTAIADLFGPDHGGAQERDTSHAGALLVGDATLLALPVRSLQSSFKWVTCPQAITRFARTAERLGLELKLPTITQPARDKALGQGDAKLFLEEFRFEQSQDDCIEALAQALAPVNGAELVWVQDEPENQGGWPFISANLPAAIAEQIPGYRLELQRVSREWSSAPSVGSLKVHKLQEEALLQAALG